MASWRALRRLLLDDEIDKLDDARKELRASRADDEFNEVLRETPENQQRRGDEEIAEFIRGVDRLSPEHRMRIWIRMAQLAAEQDLKAKRHVN